MVQKKSSSITVGDLILGAKFTTVAGKHGTIVERPDSKAKMKVSFNSEEGRKAVWMKAESPIWKKGHIKGITKLIDLRAHQEFSTASGQFTVAPTNGMCIFDKMIDGIPVIDTKKNVRRNMRFDALVKPLGELNA